MLDILFKRMMPQLIFFEIRKRYTDFHYYLLLLILL